MKNTDIALVILIAAVSIGLSYWLGNLLLGDPSDDTYQISYVEGVSAEIMQPDIETFNPSGINPTVEVIIGTCKEVEVDKKKDKSGGGDNPDNPEPDNPEPEPTPE